MFILLLWRQIDMMLLRWYFVCRYLFNDAEVKPFDPAQIASECFGGEMTVVVFKLLHNHSSFLCVYCVFWVAW